MDCGRGSKSGFPSLTLNFPIVPLRSARSFSVFAASATWSESTGLPSGVTMYT